MLSTKSHFAIATDEISSASAELAQHMEQQVEANGQSARYPSGSPMEYANAPLNFDDSVLAGFRKGYREHATATAQKTLVAGMSATEPVASFSDEVAIGSAQLNEDLEDQVQTIAPKHITEYDSHTTEATENEKLEQEFDYLEPAQEDDYLVETEEDAQKLEPEPQVLQEGDLVDIVSSRQGAEFVWQIGVVKVAHTVGCVVEVLAKTLWFCVDELVLVSAAPQVPS